MIRKTPPHLLAVVTLGAVSQVGQVLFMRELLMVFHGNELSIGLILAAWLVWVGVGSHLGGFLVEKISRPRLLLGISAGGTMLALPVTVLLVRGMRGFLGVLPGAYLSLSDMLVSCLVLMAPACLLFGAQFVFLSGIWRQSEQDRETSGAEKTYIGEAGGTMLGGIIFTFVMVHYLSPLQSAALAGAAIFATALFLIIRRPKARTGGIPGNKAVVAAAVFAFILFSLPFLAEVDDWAYRLQWSHFAPGHELVQMEHSKHGAISVAQRRDQFSFFQSGHLVFTTAGPETAVSGLEEGEAVDFSHLAMVQHKDPRRVLLIGGGLRGVLSEILEHPVNRVDYIELDETLTEAARPYLPGRTRRALDDPRVNLIHTDGRLFTKTTGETYDLVMVDQPDPFTAELNRYYTGEFFREVGDLLREDGVFVTRLTSTSGLRETAMANRNATIYHTLNEVFPEVLPAGERAMLFFAGNAPGQVSVDPEVLHRRYEEREVEAADFSSGRYFTLLEETQLRRVNWVVRRHGRHPTAHLTGPGTIPPSPGTLAELQKMEADLPPVVQRYFVNRDLQPIGYFYTLMFWENLTREDIAFSLGQLLHIQTWWVIPAVGVFLLAGAGLRAAAGGRRGQRRLLNFALLLTVFTTGLSTMALQIALLFSFQGVYGFVYEMVGLITGIFMFGLGLGAYLTHRYVKEKVDVNLLARVQLLMAALAVLIALILPPAAAVRFPVVVFALFSMLTFMAGMLNGIDFPLAVACYTALHRRADRSTGVVYGVELFGACSGAILASAAVAPILGIVACCLLAAAASGTASAVLFFSRGVEQSYVL